MDERLAELGPVILFAIVLVALVILVNRHGRHLGRHDDWLRVLELRIENLHKDRAQKYARSLQVTRASNINIPPPGTVEVTDEMLIISPPKKDPPP